MKKAFLLFLISIIIILSQCLFFCPPVQAQIFGIVIGDSLAAGYPGTGSAPFQVFESDGTLHHDQFGSVANALEQRFRCHVFNFGSGGDTTVKVWARWRRDVLGEIYDPGDGRGNISIPNGCKPAFIILIIGINDIYWNNPVPDDTIKANLINMILSANQNNIPIYICDIPPAHIGVNHNIEYQAHLRAMNEWEWATLPGYGAHMIPFHKWYSDDLHGRADDRDPEYQGVDGSVHLMPEGYDDFGRFVANHIEFK